MSTPWFSFKQFTLWHDKCAMKVGTDGVLLGAWTNVKGHESVLDIGAGTGLVALMLAQRTRGNVTAVEIDGDAAQQASENCMKSPWNKQMEVHHLSIQEYAKTATFKFDLIVSNPPYFSNKLKAPDAIRAIARHSDQLSLETIIEVSSSFLTENGRLSVILPLELRADFIKLIKGNNYWIIRESNVKSFPQKSPFRVMFEVSKQSVQVIEKNEIIIRESSKGTYTDAFKELTKDYYLAF
jgi:tRNA1Val (adenine37-N6)-methyltransferase